MLIFQRSQCPLKNCYNRCTSKSLVQTGKFSLKVILYLKHQMYKESLGGVPEKKDTLLMFLIGKSLPCCGNWTYFWNSFLKLCIFQVNFNYLPESLPSVPFRSTNPLYPSTSSPSTNFLFIHKFPLHPSTPSILSFQESHPSPSRNIAPFCQSSPFRKFTPPFPYIQKFNSTISLHSETQPHHFTTSRNITRSI